MVEELSGEELVLVLLVVSEAVVVLVKILLPGTVRGLFTAPNTGAILGYKKKGGGIVIRLLSRIDYVMQLGFNT